MALPGWSSAVYPAALLLAVVLPFEAIPPVAGSLTDEKIVLLLLAGAWLMLGARALPTRDETRALLPTGVFLLVALVSALLARDSGDEALRFAARLAVVGFVLLVTLRLAQDQARVAGLLWAIVIGGGLSASLGLAEALGWSALEPVFRLFKVAPTRVGGELRVSASFQYATIAAMYFEMVAPLAIGLAATTRRQWLRAVAVAIAAMCTANVVLSLTRAGVVTLLLVYGGLGAVAVTSRRKLRGPILVGAATLLGGVGLLLARNPVFDLRLVTESDADWYGAAYSAPAAIDVAADESARVALEVRNEGRITWVRSGPHPFALGYRWLSADGSQVLDLPVVEVVLPRDVGPGETVQLQADVQVPNVPAGTYRIDWGMLQRDVLQFYERGWADAATRVNVGAASGAPPSAPPAMTPRDDGEAPWVVGRMSLWSAALRMIRVHPFLGVGPDNFRHFYGAELGLETWDERVQANNLYLEIVADMGVLGLAAFTWVIARPLAATLRLLAATAPAPASAAAPSAAPAPAVASAAAPSAAPAPAVASAAAASAAPDPTVASAAAPGAAAAYLRLGAGLALVAFLVHGLADSFLAFTPTALLFWIVIGVTLRGVSAAPRPRQEEPTTG